MVRGFFWRGRDFYDSFASETHRFSFDSHWSYWRYSLLLFFYSFSFFLGIFPTLGGGCRTFGETRWMEVMKLQRQSMLLCGVGMPSWRLLFTGGGESASRDGSPYVWWGGFLILIFFIFFFHPDINHTLATTCITVRRKEKNPIYRKVGKGKRSIFVSWVFSFLAV